MRDTKGALTYLRGQATSHSTAWQGKCLVLCRTARDIPALYPSALAASQATPSEHRVRQVSQVRRGMVAFWDDPNDSNPFGHITTVAGRDPKTGELLHWTNDAAGPGRVSVVRHSFFPQYWGDSFLFASDWLNGQTLDLGQPVRPAPAPAPHPELPLAGGAPAIQEALKRLERAAAYHRKVNHTRLVKALERDIAHLKSILKTYGGLA